MKILLALVCLTAGTALGQSGAARPPVADCFKVHALLRADEAHYWADWTNTCPYTIDAVYVLVTFQDKFRNYVGDGVWPMYFVAPGAHHVNRFSVSSEISDFASVRLRKITADAREGLRSSDRHAMRAKLPSGFVGDPGASKIVRLAGAEP